MAKRRLSSRLDQAFRPAGGDRVLARLARVIGPSGSGGSSPRQRVWEDAYRRGMGRDGGIHAGETPARPMKPYRPRKHRYRA
jgi:hypothetical protein